MLPFVGMAQSETMDKWHEKYDDAFTMFFYKNTLEMLNQTNSEEFEAIIKDIEKMKLLRIDKKEDGFDKEDYKEVKADYKKEGFVELMTMRRDGSNIVAFIKEEDKVTKGIVVLMDEEESMMILDIKGAISMDKIAELASMAKSID